MKKFIKYHSIGQFRDVVRSIKQSAQYVRTDEDGTVIYDKNVAMPKISFHGTVKLHGTNASISYSKNEGIWAQKRTDFCTIEKDNAGFAFFVEQNKDWFIGTFDRCFELEHSDILTVYGEWCGEGIQRGVAISNLPKMFVIFGFKLTHEGNEKWLDHNCSFLKNNLPEHIYNIEYFPCFELEIDFNHPQESQNKLVEITEEVEKRCPVGMVLGSNGLGEGVVWRGFYKKSYFVFKVKGEKHSSSKVKKLANVDIEKIASIREFVDYAVTENRLNQGIKEVFFSENIDPTIQGMGDFIRWVFNDVIKEELDTLLENNLTPKDIGSAIASKARPWFQSFLDNQILNPDSTTTSSGRCSL